MLRVACLQRWMLCTLRIRVPTRVLALPVLWPWTESIDLGVPLREHNRSRGSLRNTYLRLVLGPLLSPSSRLLSLLYVTLPPLPSYHLDSFRRYTGNILGKYMRLRKPRSKRHLRTLSSFSHGRRGWPISIFISTDISVDQVDRS